MLQVIKSKAIKSKGINTTLIALALLIQAPSPSTTTKTEKSIIRRTYERIETTATINDLGQLTLDAPLILTKSRRVRVIVLIPEDDEPDPDENPDEIMLEGIRQGLHEAFTGQTIPLAQMWDGIDAD